MKRINGEMRNLIFHPSGSTVSTSSTLNLSVSTVSTSSTLTLNFSSLRLHRLHILDFNPRVKVEDVKTVEKMWRRWSRRDGKFRVETETVLKQRLTKERCGTEVRQSRGSYPLLLLKLLFPK